MTVDVGSPLIQKIERASELIQASLGDAETAIGAVTSGFENLARQANGVLEPVASIIAYVEDENFRTILLNVEALAVAAKGFIRERLDATGGMLETVTTEAKLLDRLSELTRGQRSIARETQTLSVLTNIEVARLGELGAGFQYLAHELDEFSKTVVLSTKELASHTDERKASVNETRHMLAAGLPRIRKEFSRIEADLGRVLTELSASNDQLRRVPEQFRAGVEEIAAQIAGVVAAIQSHDITRQQLEHVQEGLDLIAGKLTEAEEAEGEATDETALVSAGLAIQSYQLRNIDQTVSQWVDQIGICLDSILRISSSEMGGIGPLVLEQEKNLSSNLACIEALEQECQGENEEVQNTFAGLSNLMQLVSEHVEKSRYVRDRLQLLTFNSIVEANHLGAKADAILEISQSIKRISISWSEMTDRSAQAMSEILQLVEGAKEKMQAFSAGGNEELLAAQEKTHQGLENLRSTATCVAHEAARAEETTIQMQAEIAVASKARDQLRSSFSAVGSAQCGIEEVKGQIDKGSRNAIKQADRREVEALFSRSYTTEREREVLRAAVAGKPLPCAQQNLAGNSAELF